MNKKETKEKIESLEAQVDIRQRDALKSLEENKELTEKNTKMIENENNFLRELVLHLTSKPIKRRDKDNYIETWQTAKESERFRIEPITRNNMF